MEAERLIMERLAEAVEQQMEDVRTMVAEIWTTMAAIVEIQKKILEQMEGDRAETETGGSSRG